MIHDSHDRMIERFTDGELSPAEHHRFMRSMALDKGTRRLADADRAIVDGIAKERAGFPAGSREPGEHLLARLAATPSAAGARGGGGGISVGIWQGIIAIVALLGLAIGTFAVAPLLNREHHQAMIPPPVAQPPAPISRPAVEAPAEPGKTGPGEIGHRMKAAQGQIPRENDRTRQNMVVKETVEETEIAPPKHSQHSFAEDDGRDHAPLPVITSDTVHFRMNVRK
ncbi:MAG: hypothetical protein ABIR47_17225 [Candidatus Kapaibacterium sp.]